MENQKKYYLQFSLLCIGTFLLSYGLSQIVNRFFYTNNFWIPTLFFGITTWLINILLINGQSEPKEFAFKTLAMSMARLLLCMVFVLVYKLINKADFLAFTCHFMIQYAIFTIFEISNLVTFIKKNY
jgi:hypothetical protein